MKLLGSTKNKVAKDENGEIVACLEITDVVLFNYITVNNDYQHDSRVLYTFVLNKLFSRSLDILSKIFAFLKIFNSEIFPYSEAWSPGQNYKLLEIEEKTNLALVIN